MNKFKAFILDLFFPNRCPVCREFIEYDKFICEKCGEQLKLCKADDICPECGKQECICSENMHYDKAVAAFAYEDAARLGVLSLKDGHKMYSSYDVGKQLDRKRGYLALDNFDYGSLFNTSFPMNKADRIATFDSGSTHAMTLTAVDLDANGKPVKWKVENSWGADNGFAGCFIMTNDWFNEYMFRLVVNKKYASEQLLKEFDQKPTMLTPDDPLFQLED